MATVPPISTGTGASAASGALDNVEIASNFTTFLQLLTTQLKNENPLDPLEKPIHAAACAVRASQAVDEVQRSALRPGFAGKELRSDRDARLCRRDRRGGWIDLAALQRKREMEYERQQALDRDRDDKRFNDRAVGLHGHHRRQSGQPDLGRPRQ